LIACAFWDWLGQGLSGAHVFYEQPIPNFGNWVVIDRATWSGFLGNLLFLQSVFCDPFGSDSPLWSLSYEFWYYMLFPLLVLLFSGMVSWGRRVIYFALALLITLMIGLHIALYFLVWLAGAMLTFPQLRQWRKPRARFGVLGLTYLAAFAFALLISRFDVLRDFGELPVFLLAFSFVLVLSVLIRLTGQARPSAYSFVAGVVASFSYTLYLTHMPLLLFIRAFFATQPRWQPDMLHLVYGCAIALGVSAYSYAIYWLTESRTGQVRAYLSRALDKNHGVGRRQLAC
jgi:peptidoglycan/LPS O-acetylase OafA/YrhL